MTFLSLFLSNSEQIVASHSILLKNIKICEESPDYTIYLLAENERRIYHCTIQCDIKLIPPNRSLSAPEGARRGDARSWIAAERSGRKRESLESGRRCPVPR